MQFICAPEKRSSGRAAPGPISVAVCRRISSPSRESWVSGSSASRASKALHSGDFATGGVAVVRGRSESAARNCRMSRISSSPSLCPSCMYAMRSTASASVATLPSWKYGAVSITLRSDGTLKTKRSTSRPVTLKRPSSDSCGYGCTTPLLTKRPPPTPGPTWHVVQPSSMKRSSPRSSSGVSACSSPCSHSSKRETETSVRSKAAIAAAALSKVTGSFSPGNASENADVYGSSRRRSVATSAEGSPISDGLRIGPFACVTRSFARPSRKWARSNRALSTVGVLRSPRCCSAPSETVRLSMPARAPSSG